MSLSGAVKLPRGLAPHLRWHMRVRAATFPDTPHVAQEVKELKALLAVAQEVRVARVDLEPWPRWKRLQRAIEKLQYVSKPARRARLEESGTP
jgi:hypothetical protein